MRTSLNINDFNTEVIPHMDALLGFALKMTANEENANDLLQETLMKAFRFFGQFEQGSNSKAWLFQIMKNTFINNYRKNSREPQKVDYEDIQNFYENILPVGMKADYVQNDALHDLFDDEISEALDTLPDDFRTIVILSDIEGYTYEEVAEFVDCPIGTVRSRLHRARKALFSKLHNYADKNGYMKSPKNIKKNITNEDSTPRIEFSPSFS